MMLPPPATAPSGPQLRDIHLPPAPSWWPPAPGWWIVAGLLVGLLIAALLRWRQLRQRARREGQLPAQADALGARFAADGDAAALAAGLHQLLRRAARSLHPAGAHVEGARWRALLAQVDLPAAQLDQLGQLDAVMYQPGKSLDATAAVTATRAWLIAAARARRRGNKRPSISVLSAEGERA